MMAKQMVVMQIMMMQQSMAQQSAMMQQMAMSQQPQQPPGGQSEGEREGGKGMTKASNAGAAHGGSSGSAKVSKDNLQQAKQYQNLMLKKGNNEETIFVGGLRKSTEEDQVFSHFSKFGELDSVDIKRMPDGTSRGFAFVRFKHKDGVEKALEKPESHMIDNKWVAVRRRDDQSSNAGRAASNAKTAEAKPKDPNPPTLDDDREEDFTTKYLTMAQQLGSMQQRNEEVSNAEARGQIGMMASPMMMMSPMMSNPQMIMMGSQIASVGPTGLMMGAGASSPVMGSAHPMMGPGGAMTAPPSGMMVAGSASPMMGQGHHPMLGHPMMAAQPAGSMMCHVPAAMGQGHHVPGQAPPPCMPVGHAYGASPDPPIARACPYDPQR